MIVPHQAPVHFHVLPGNTDVTAPDLAILDEPAGDMLRRIDGNGEADSLRGQNHRRVDTDDFPARVDERPAGIAGIQPGVGLDYIVDQPSRLRAKRAAQRAHDTRRDGALKAIRVADGDGELADAERG